MAYWCWDRERRNTKLLLSLPNTQQLWNTEWAKPVFTTCLIAKWWVNNRGESDWLAHNLKEYVSLFYASQECFKSIPTSTFVSEMTWWHAGRNTVWASRTKGLVCLPLFCLLPCHIHLSKFFPHLNPLLWRANKTPKGAAQTAATAEVQWITSEPGKCGKSCQVMQLHQTRRSRCVWWHLILGSQRASKHLIMPSKKKALVCRQINSGCKLVRGMKGGAGQK